MKIPVKLIAALLLTASCVCADTGLTTVAQTIKNPDGTAFNGTVQIALNEKCVQPDGSMIYPEAQNFSVSEGALSIGLYPNTSCAPSGTAYLVRYRSRGNVLKSETWVVAAVSPTTVDAVRVAVLPALTITMGLTQLAQGGATTGQLLRWSGSAWAPWTATFLTNPFSDLGDTSYGGAAGVMTRLAGNATATRKFLRQTGNGTTSAAPAWDTLQAGDVPDLSATYAASLGGHVTWDTENDYLWFGKRVYQTYASPENYAGFFTQPIVDLTATSPLPVWGFKSAPVAVSGNRAPVIGYGFSLRASDGNANMSIAGEHTGFGGIHECAATTAAVGTNCFGADLQISKPAGASSNIGMFGLAVGFHKIPTLGTEANIGLHLWSDDLGEWSGTTRSGSAITVEGSSGWTWAYKYFKTGLGNATSATPDFGINQNAEAIMPLVTFKAQTGTLAVASESGYANVGVSASGVLVSRAYGGSEQVYSTTGHNHSGTYEPIDTTIVRRGASNTYTAGYKQVFTPSASTAGLKIAPAALPSAPAAGDVAVDSADANKLKFWDGSTWQTGSGGTPTAVTQASEFDTAGSFSVASAGSGRAVSQSTWREDPTTHALTSGSTVATLQTWKDQSADPAAPGAGMTEWYSLAGVPKVRAGASGAAKSLATTDQLPSIASTTGALKGSGLGGAVSVTGTSSDCVKVDGSSGTCGSGNDYTVITDSTTARTLTSGDCASAIHFTSGSAVTVTLPNVEDGCNALAIQDGAGTLSFIAGSGITLYQLAGSASTAGQNAMVLLLQKGTTRWNLSGGLTGAGGASNDYTITTDATTSRTLSSSDCGSVIHFTSGSAIAVTVPNVELGCNVIAAQDGAGTVSFTASGVTLYQLAGSASTAGQHASVLLYQTTSSAWNLSGGLTGAVTVPNVVTAAAVLGSGQITVGDGSRGLASSTLDAAVAKLTKGVPSAASASDVAGLFSSSGAFLGSDGTKKDPPANYTVTTDATTARTLAAGDCASVISFTSSSAVTVTVPTGLGGGCNALLYQAGSGQVSLTGSGTTLRQLAGTAATAGQYSTILAYAVTDSAWELSGQLAGIVAVSHTRPIGCAVGDPAGSALATGVLCYVVAPATCAIQSWDVLVDSGTATVGVWKIASGTAIPTVSNSIVASAAPAIATGTAIHSTALTGWTTSVSKYDIFGFNLSTTSGPKYIYVGVNCDETF